MASTKTEIKKQIKEFFGRIGERTALTHSEKVELFKLYSDYYNTTENNYSCSLCVARVYSRLIKIK